MGMLYVLEKRNYTPQDIAKYFARVRKTTELKKRIQVGKKEFEGDRMGLFPNKEFLEGLERLLHKARPVAIK